MKQAYTHIFFDHDGVLVDTEPLYFQATQEVLKRLGVTLGYQDYLGIQAVGGNAWQAALDAGATEEDVRMYRQQRDERYQQLLVSADIDIAGVEQVLATLKEHFALAIVTTAKQTDFDLIHASRGIVSYFDLILTNKDYARSKPEPDPYLAALKHFGVSPEQALVVEDSERGLRSAVAAGIDCVTVYHPFTEPQDFSAAKKRIQNLNDLVEWLL